MKNPPTHTKVGDHGGRARQTTGGGRSHWRPSWWARKSPGPPRRLWAHRDTSRWKTWRIPASAGENGPAPPPAVRVAANLVRGGNQGDHPAGQAGPTKAPLEVLCDRRQLEDAYVATHGPRSRGWSSKGVMATSRSNGA